MLNIEPIDDPVVPDATPNFAGGLVSYAPRAQLGANQFFLGANTMVGKSGVIQTRRGCSYLGTQGVPTFSVYGMGYLETTAGVKKLLVLYANATLSQYDGTTWSAAGGWTPTTGYQASIVQGIDKLYIANGIDNMRSWDGTTYVDLGAGATDAPKCKYLVWGTNRLIAAGIPSAPDTVAFSDVLDPSSTHWPASSQKRIGGGDGDPITGIAMFSKTLLAVFKRNKAYLVNIDPSLTVAQFTVDEVPGNIGCVEHRTIATVGRDLWFLSTSGMRSLGRVLQGEDSQVSQPVSQPISDIIQAAYTEANHEYESRAVYFRGRLLLQLFASAAVPNDSSSTDGRYTHSFNVDLGIWEGRWSGFTFTNFAITRFGTTTQLVLGQAGGYVVHWRHETGAAEVADDFEDDNFAGASQAIPTRIGTRAHTFGAELNDKQGLAAEIEFDTGNTADTATVKLITDENAAVTLTSSLTPSGRRPLTLLHQPPGRAHSLEISSTAKKLAVRNVKLSAFVATMAVGT